jgi:hypothetical protein
VSTLRATGQTWPFRRKYTRTVVVFDVGGGAGVVAVPVVVSLALSPPPPQPAASSATTTPIVTKAPLMGLTG